MSGLSAAQEAARKAIERTYQDICTILERRDVRDDKTGITRKNGEFTAVENQPCKLSFEKLSAVVRTETAATVAQGTKLFVAPEVNVRPGSKIIVEHAGVKTEYTASGKPAVYPTHSEIMLELFRGWG